MGQRRTEDVEEQLSRLRGILPDGLSLTVWENSANTLRDRLRILLSNGIGGFALVFGGAFVWQHLLIDGLLLAYVVVAARMGALERERSTKVTNLRVVGGQNTGSPSYLRAVGDR